MGLIDGFSKPWLFVFGILFAAFIAVVVADFFAPQSELCKSSLPFSASWQAEFPHGKVVYWLSEGSRNYSAKFSYYLPGQQEPGYTYFENFDKEKGKAVIHNVSGNGCVSDSFDSNAPYFNPFEVTNCFATRGSLFKIISREVGPEEFAAPQECGERAGVDVNSFSGGQKT